MNDQTSDISSGYDQTDFEIVTHRSGNYELPLSTPARYQMAEETPPSTFTYELEKRGYVFIAPNK
jgi:hypothetical protein